jgi:thiamine-monophosphate kinase
VAVAPDRPDEFESIDRLFKPLAAGAPEARGLNDDVATIAPRPGQDLVISTDAMVEGVHFLPTDPLDLVARKLLRANLSDLAAKGADAYGYLLSVSWSERCGWPEREAFAAGLRQDQAHFGVHLFGGDTTATPGPLTATVTAFGWVPHGRTVARAGARSGDLILVSGLIGDAHLGLAVAKGELTELEPPRLEYLQTRYQIPEPRTGLAKLVRDHASASADVSDGLIADVGHIAKASGLRAQIDLEAMPISRAARAWLQHRVDAATALRDLAAGGDDYEIVCCARADRAEAIIRAAQDRGDFTVIGRMVAGEGVSVSYLGDQVKVDRAGWRHR